MLLITCPVCAVTNEETEFSCGGLYAPPGETRHYTRGVVREYWLCAAGCGSWFGLARHSVNQRILGSWTIGKEPPPLAGETA